MPEILKFEHIEYDIQQILRYAKTTENDVNTLTLINDCVNEIGEKLSYRICFSKFEIGCVNGMLDLGFCYTDSNDLKKHLTGCDEIIVFAATVGFALDRIVEKYTSVSPTRAYILDAIGNERIESLCDAFEKHVADMYENIVFRFSPGYGDLPLDIQNDIFTALNLNKTLGITLNSSLLMTPTKSVCAIIGLMGENNECT